jgi:hypothetical protein
MIKYLGTFQKASRPPIRLSTTNPRNSKPSINNTIFPTTKNKCYLVDIKEKKAKQVLHLCLILMTVLFQQHR